MIGFEINKESTYKFEIKNYTIDDVDWDVVTGKRGTVDYTTGVVGTHAYVELTGQELIDVIDLDNTAAVTPYIFLTDKALISKGYDVLVEVTETCDKLDKSEKGYYFVVFKALDAKLELYNVKLGTFKEVNDYVYASEVVKSIKDSYNKEIFKWDEATSKWTVTDDASVYGITADDADKVSVTIDQKLIFNADPEDSFGGNLYPFTANAPLLPTDEQATETGINWWNLGTDLQVDKDATFKVIVKFDNQELISGTATVRVLKTADSIHPLHTDPAQKNVYKDGWFYAVAE
jgi:hypothetical protein